MPHQRKQFYKEVHFSNDSSDERVTYLEGFRKPKIEIEETVPYTELDLLKKKFDWDVSVPSTISCKAELIETTATTSIATTSAATTTTVFFDTPSFDLSSSSTANQPVPESPNLQLLVPFTSAIPVSVPSTISCKSVLIETTDTPIATTTIAAITPTTELFDASDLDFSASSIADEPVSDSPDLQLSAPFTSTIPVPFSLDSQSPASSTRSGRKYGVSTTSVSSLSSTSTSTRKRIATKRNSTATKIARNSEEYSDPDEWITENFQPPVVNKFSFPSGIQCNVDVTSTPLNCFRHFVDDKIIKIIVQETNRYANNVITSTVLSHRSRMKQWKDTTPSEIWEFLALIILMGMVKKPALPLYFSTDPIYSTPIFGAAMPKNRFLSILSNLCFSNSKKVTEDKRLYEIKSISDILRQNFRKNYLPKEHVCIDESLMLWKGQLGNDPTKRPNFGIRSYELCESRSGYVWNFLMYAESSTTFTDDGNSQGEEVVMTLMEPLLGKNYKVYVDRFFSSPSLAKRLLEAQTYMCGTVMKNRAGMPKNFPSEQLNHGEMKTCQKNGISVFTWKDKKEVNLISTMSDNTFTETTKKDKKINEFIRKPTCVVQYNKHIGGVSICDSVILAYPSMHKSTKWYKKVFFHMIDISLYNAWIIYKALGNNVPLLEFRHDVVQALLRKHHVPRIINRKRSGENPLRLTERHFPALNEKEDGKIVFRRCKLCFLKKQRKETKYICPDCNIPLCTYPCFRNYHTKLNF